jgi:hypothetical protein
LLGGLFHLRQTLFRRKMPIKPQIEVTGGNSRIGNGVVRLKGNGRFKVAYCFSEFFGSAKFIMVKTPVQIQLIGVGIVGISFEGRLFLFTK